MNRLLAATYLIGAICVTPGVATGQAATAITRGNEWRELSEPMRFGYVIGVIESADWLRLVDRAAPPLVRVDSPTSRLVGLLETCEGKGMTREQLVAMVDKYLKDHPEKWHLLMPELVLSALRAACSP
jgi:hypothetical protein